MNRSAVTMLALSLSGAGALLAQHPVVAEQKTAYTNNKNNLTKAAEKIASLAVPGLTGGREARTGRGVGGGDALGREVGEQVLRVGGTHVAAPSVMIREEMGDARGLIGMDVMCSTVIAVCADETRPAMWMVPRG